MICGGGADTEQNVSKSEQTWGQKNEIQPTSAIHIKLPLQASLSSFMMPSTGATPGILFTRSSDFGADQKSFFHCNLVTFCNVFEEGTMSYFWLFSPFFSEKQLITRIVLRRFAPTERTSFSNLSFSLFSLLYCYLYFSRMSSVQIYWYFRWIHLTYFVSVVALSYWKIPEGFQSKIFHASAWSILPNLQIM